MIPNKYCVKMQSATEIECETESGCFSNGHSVNKTVTLCKDGSWKLCIGGKSVDLTKLFISPSFSSNAEGIEVVFKAVDKLQLCGGIQINKSIVVSRYHTLDSWQSVDKSCIRSVRSLMCSRALAVNSRGTSCRICQKMTISQPENKENVQSPSAAECSPKPVLDQLTNLFPNASENMLELLMEQSKNVGRQPRGRKWSQKFIGLCMQLYNRSPHCYEILCQSQLLVLPSKSLLILYKNAIKQKPGFDDNIFRWMRVEADRQKVPEGERYGGIIFDEMAIQADLQIDKQGNLVELSGLTDYGKEGDLFHSLRQGTREKHLGKYVLQLMFLGMNGFRFPFAHFITNSIQASELYGLFWRAVYMLHIFGFNVLYTCMDGAQANRSFMHMCLGDKVKHFIARSPCTMTDIIFLMDYSHVMKKLRNNLMKSGINAHCTRLLTLPNNCTIQWQMFVDCFSWDKQNALQLHRKLTQEHFFLDSQLKMRNHLAEEVLNSDMLNLMKTYQQSLGGKGEVLNGVVELLEQTSIMVECFRDMRPVKSHDDPRLARLTSVSSWFEQWESSIMKENNLSQKDKNCKLLSQQSREDVQSCLKGFVSLCYTTLHKSPSTFVTPGITNSDVIENVFNQQRSTYHGANSNPSALQYQRAINSVLIGQNIVSKKSNAGKSVATYTAPYSFALKQPLKRKRCTDKAEKFSNIKVIRF